MKNRPHFRGKLHGMYAAVLLLWFAMTGVTCRQDNPPPPNPQPGNMLGITWNLYSPLGVDKGGDRIEAGRVNDVLETSGNGVLIAADLGGVYISTGSSFTVSVSQDWDNPDMNCLAAGPDANLYFAGGGTSTTNPLGALYVTDKDASPAILQRWFPIPNNVNFGVINDMIVVSGTRTLVLATSNGIYHAQIPTAAGGGGYTFIQAYFTTVPSPAFFGIEEGPGQTVVITPDNGTRSATDPGFYVGSFDQAGDLNFVPANLPAPANWGFIQRTSLTAGRTAATRNFMYAATSQGGGKLFKVYRSIDGGRNWVDTNCRINGGGFNAATPGYEIGTQGMGRNNAIGCHPTNPNVVALGWVWGPYISTDGGATFTGVGIDANHEDHTRMYFSALNDRLYLTSDGGLCYLEKSWNAQQVDLSNPVYHFEYNHRLPNIQFLSPAVRQFFGESNSSIYRPEYFGGGLQDNGTIYRMDGAGFWKQLCGTDGGIVDFPAHNAGAFWCGWTVIHAYSYFNSDGSLYKPEVNTYIRNGAPGDEPERDWVVGNYTAIPSPDYVNTEGHTMYMVCNHVLDQFAGPPPSPDMNNIYGIFSNSDGTGHYASFLFDMPLGPSEIVSYVASPTGRQIFVGTRGNAQVATFTLGSDGVFRLTPTSGIPALSYDFVQNYVVKIATMMVNGSPVTYALRRNQGNGEIFKFNPVTNQWTQVRSPMGGVIYSIEIDPYHSPARLLAATDQSVFATNDDGANWSNISQGLPRMPHCSDLSVVRAQNGSVYYYLSTFGWSAWRAVAP